MDIDNYSYDFEDRKYLRPETSRDEQMGFIDTLRDTQAQNNQQIETQTHSLGRDLTPDLGGLSGSGGYFQGRYQTPQTNATIANLKTAAQLSALNTVLSNMQTQAKQRYSKAQQAYQKRQYNKANSIGGYGPTSTTESPVTTGNVIDSPLDEGGDYVSAEDELRRLAEERATAEAQKKAEQINQIMEQVVGANDTSVKTPEEAFNYWKNIRR